MAKALTASIAQDLRAQAKSVLGNRHAGIMVAPETLLALLQHSEQRADLLKAIKAIGDVRARMHAHILAPARTIVDDTLTKINSTKEIEFEEYAPSFD
jgi:hypothetical protein